MAARRYSLFEKKDGAWVRMSAYSMPLAQARQHWQGALLAGAIVPGGHERSLRSVKATDLMCLDCGAVGERTGHQTCQYPGSGLGE